MKTSGVNFLQNIFTVDRFLVAQSLPQNFLSLRPAMGDSEIAKVFQGMCPIDHRTFDAHTFAGAFYHALSAHAEAAFHIAFDRNFTCHVFFAAQFRHRAHHFFRTAGLHEINFFFREQTLENSGDKSGFAERAVVSGDESTKSGSFTLFYKEHVFFRARTGDRDDLSTCRLLHRAAIMERRHAVAAANENHAIGFLCRAVALAKWSAK